MGEVDMTNAKTFASAGDLAEKTISFGEIGPDLYAYTAEGDPNSGVIVGDDGCLVIDTQATPAMAGVAWASTTRQPSSPTMTPEFGSPSAV